MSEVLELLDFCVPAARSTTLHRVWSAALRRLLADLGQVLRTYARDPDVAAFARVVGPLARQQPGALAAVVRRPEVGVWIRCLRPGAAQPVDPAVGVPVLLGCVALELARRGVLPGELALRRPPPRLVSGAGRLAVPVPEGTTILRFSRGSVVAEGRGGTRSLPLRADDGAFVELSGSGARLALVDDDPLAGLEAHPDKEGNALDLGGRPVGQWRDALAGALGLIGEHLPSFRAEIELLLHQVVPVGFDEQRHLSASIQESIGTVYLSLHPNRMTMAEAIVHEVSHNKLAALLELDPVLHNPRDERHASPVRPDPRPLHGVLLAVHAFLPVAALYEAMIDARVEGSEHPSFRRRFAEVIRGNHDGARVLRAHARPTAAGRQILDEIHALDGRFLRWLDSLEGAVR